MNKNLNDIISLATNTSDPKMGIELYGVLIEKIIDTHTARFNSQTIDVIQELISHNKFSEASAEIKKLFTEHEWTEIVDTIIEPLLTSYNNEVLMA